MTKIIKTKIRGKEVRLQIVTIPMKTVKIRCKKHGVVKVKRAYDPFLKKMTAISCIKCPDVLTVKDMKKYEKESE